MPAVLPTAAGSNLPTVTRSKQGTQVSPRSMMRLSMLRLLVS